MLIETLTSRHGYPVVDETSLEAFLTEPGDRVLFVTGDPDKLLDSNDIAVILPELVAHFQGRLYPAVVARAAEPHVCERFKADVKPTLVFVRDGQLVGSIPRVRDWDDYIEKIRGFLDGAAPVLNH
jgi:hydrogenase-1 operon protein HyaE